MRVLITGGAGFVGANLAIRLAAAGDADVVALDNLHRRGSELNLTRLRDAGATFVQGDVRELDDLLALDRFDAIVECSAEPSTLAGMKGSVHAHDLQTLLSRAIDQTRAAHAGLDSSQIAAMDGLS